MKIEVVTLFPKLIEAGLGESILFRAQEAAIIATKVHDLRSFATDRHQVADDYPYGGGAGMVLKPEPIYAAMTAIVEGVRPRPLVIYPSAQGRPFDQRVAVELTKERHLVFLCGHYKGVDQRAIDRWVDREYSLGDYVLTGGELPALAMIDATVRLLPGVLGDAESAAGDSFQSGGLGPVHYTRPEEIEGQRPPGVLLCGDHKSIESWRKLNAGLLTRAQKADLTTSDRNENGSVEERRQSPNKD